MKWLQATSTSGQPEAPYCDFAFVLGKDFVPLHRAILAARSRFFKKMLLSQWQSMVSFSILTFSGEVLLADLAWPQHHDMWCPLIGTHLVCFLDVAVVLALAQIEPLAHAHGGSVGVAAHISRSSL